jgi:hypothetical protein
VDAFAFIDDVSIAPRSHQGVGRPPLEEETVSESC